MKATLNKLAIFGGEPAVTTKGDHFIWPRITDDTRMAVLAQLNESVSIYDRSGIIEKVEDRLADYFGVKHALLTNSGTQALHSMYIGAELSKLDEILVPSYTFFATVTPLLFTGAVPKLVECGPDGNIDVNHLERHLTSRTRAIVVTHMWGRPCKMNEIMDFANSHGLMVFEDASHAFGSTYNNKRVGSFGNAAALSLQGAKTITGGEGGVLLTNDDEIYYRALLLGHYNKRCKSEIPSNHRYREFAVTGMGFKYRIHPLAAAVVNEQLDKLPVILEGRAKRATLMISELEGIPGIEVVPLDNSSTSSWYSFLIKYHPEELGGLSIDKYYDALVAEGCKELDRPGSTCALNLHPLFQNPGTLFPEYDGRFSYRFGDFPVAECWSNSTLKLPVWDRDEDVPLVEQYLKAIVKVSENVQELLDNCR